MLKRFARVSVSILCLLNVIGFSHSAWAAPWDGHRLILEVWRIVQYAYVDDTFNGQNWWSVRRQVLKQPLKTVDETYDAIRQMLASLNDPFTRFLPPDQYRSLQVSTAGELSGVGLQIALEPDTGNLVVVTPLEGSPAEAAGLQPGDRILAIDGLAVENLSLDEAAAKMRGSIGTTVVLTVIHAGEDPVELTLVRDRIALNPVLATLQTEPLGDQQLKIGYIRLSQFNGNAVEEVAHTIRNFEAQGANAYILDLRNNPGGLMQAGIEIARLWLDRGTIVYTVNRQGIQDSYEATGLQLTQAPLVVLVNRGTASASEILAGALQDNGRALVIGEKTFGKGLIQSLFDLSDGSGLAITVAKYETPNHHDINQVGIEPDRVVALDNLVTRETLATEGDSQYRAAVESLETAQEFARAA